MSLIFKPTPFHLTKDAKRAITDAFKVEHGHAVTRLPAFFQAIERAIASYLSDREIHDRNQMSATRRHLQKINAALVRVADEVKSSNRLSRSMLSYEAGGATTIQEFLKRAEALQAASVRAAALAQKWPNRLSDKLLREGLANAVIESMRCDLRIEPTSKHEGLFEELLIRVMDAARSADTTRKGPGKEREDAHRLALAALRLNKRLHRA
jgi:hypothetical protein